ncbi:hypothetical protein [Ruegeria atlantica]|nr:hypothetical protein [Ruegeria atlantica]
MSGREIDALPTSSRFCLTVPADGFFLRIVAAGWALRSVKVGQKHKG